jgi:hypothetical protein
VRPEGLGKFKMSPHRVMFYHVVIEIMPLVLTVISVMTYESRIVYVIRMLEANRIGHQKNDRRHKHIWHRAVTRYRMNDLKNIDD